MNIIFTLLPLSLLLAVCGVLAFVWCVKKNQYNDPDGDARRILYDDEETN